MTSLSTAVPLTLQDNFLWKMERVGKVTGSRVADIVARTKSGYSASRATYVGQLVAERLSGVPAEGSYTSPAMLWGLEQEAKARAAYSFFHDVDVELAGFVPHPEIELAGASPDGLVGVGGLLEIKCPNTTTHIETLIGRSIPWKYQTQMLWQMACTGRAWCDYVSFDPRLPDMAGIIVLRLDRDEQRIKELEDEVECFLFEVEATLRQVQRQTGAVAAIGGDEAAWRSPPGSGDRGSPTRRAAPADLRSISGGAS